MLQFKTLYKHFRTVSSKTKALMLTGFVKIARRNAEVKVKVVEIVNSLLSYWDEDIQQRAMEYSILLKKSETDDSVKELFDEAFAGMPNYPDRFQTNSVLFRRMFELKNTKGFGVG